MSDERQQHHPAVVHSGGNGSGNNKIGKDNNTSVDAPPTNQGPPRKSNIHEMRNQEFVSRLMAATPPYLYSAPVGPNNFFFSDMLRSLVQARNNETARNLQLQQAALSRRPRKRVWSQPHRAYYEQQLRERKETEERHQLNNNNTPNIEKPLELTTSKPYLQLAHKYRKLDETVKELSLKQQQSSYGSTKVDETTEPATPTAANDGSNDAATTNISGNAGGGGAVDVTQNSTPPAASLPPQDLVLPPPPPVWYPPLYPPYGIDPLHFFIDLRVSGHIYDRKKENVSPLTSGNAENGATASSNETNESPNSTAITLPNKHRHGSAFTVPVPRSNEISKSLGLPTATDAINLSANTVANKFEHYAKYYDLGESKENQPNQPFLKNSYMLQHLPRLYSQFAARDLIGQHIEQNALINNNNNNNNNENSDHLDNKSEDADCDADSTDGRISNDAVDVEIIDSIKFRHDNDGDSSRCSSADDASITQID